MIYYKIEYKIKDRSYISQLYNKSELNSILDNLNDINNTALFIWTGFESVNIIHVDSFVVHEETVDDAIDKSESSIKEKINDAEYVLLKDELQSHPHIEKNLELRYNIKTLKDLPKEYYRRSLSEIRRIKEVERVYGNRKDNNSSEAL